ncbi:MAG: 7TM diverse intracellular signaling domain-containing protein [Thiolinea sp.]
MKKKFILLIMICLSGLLLSLTGCQDVLSDKTPPTAKAGILNLADWDFENDGPVELSGKWQFYWQQLLEPNAAEFSATQAVPDTIPMHGSWNGHVVNSQTLNGNGFATYRLLIRHSPRQQRHALKLLNMSSAYKLWINGKVSAHNGEVADNKEDMTPQYKPMVAAFDMRGTETELILQVSNFHHRKGGAWNPLKLGTEAQIRKQQRYRDFFDMFLLGVMFIMAVYHFGLYALRRKDPSTLYFGLFCLVIGLRSLLYREMAVHMFVPDLNWEFISAARYILTFASIPVFVLFIRSLYPLETRNKIPEVLIAIALCLMAVVILFPLHIYSYTMSVHQVISILLGIYALFVLIKAIKNGHPDARWFLLGFLALYLIVINDILSDKGLISTVLLLPLGLFIFIFSQAFVLSLRFSRSFERVEHLTQAYERFVPNNFLEHLQKDDIINVQLGDHTQRTMTILFSDIRAFTTMSEAMTPRENFNFLNAYLERMEPLITQSDGFIDKYIGDEIMALFEKTPDDAVQAGIAMLQTLEEYNQSRANSGYEPIHIGIGINTGDLMLGIIGGRNRMDGTVISDAVNLASRVEKLTKTYKTPLLISEDTYNNLSNPKQHYIRAIDQVTVRGKTSAITIYEVYDNDPVAVRESKYANRENFALALKLFTRQDLTGAMKLLQKCREATPEDHVVQIYIRRIESMEGKH